MRVALVIPVLAALTAPATAQVTARDVDLAIAAIAAQERWIAARSAHRRFVELYDYRPTVQARKPQRSGGCRYSPRGRKCWSSIEY